jgi:anti-sigma factor RsiW
MNCRDVTPLLSAERDGPLDTAALEALEQHVAACPACRRIRADLAEAAQAWRAGTARTATPDPAGEWRTLRTQIRTGSADTSLPSRGRVSARWLAAGALPFAAAAVWLAMLALDPTAPEVAQKTPAVVALAPASPVAPLPARADYVETLADSSPVVFIDEESGWLIVWAEAPASRTSG